jgi:hypothetical protein
MEVATYAMEVENRQLAKQLKAAKKAKGRLKLEGKRKELDKKRWKATTESMLRAWPGDQMPAACMAGCNGPAAAVEMRRPRFVEGQREAARRREELEKLGHEPATTLNVNFMDGDYGALVGWARDSLVHNLVCLIPPPPPFPLYTIDSYDVPGVLALRPWHRASALLELHAQRAQDDLHRLEHVPRHRRREHPQG